VVYTFHLCYLFYVAGNLSSNEIKEIFALFDKSNRG
jgi:Ca2+-binding EF-hand superfamily protein